MKYFYVLILVGYADIIRMGNGIAQSGSHWKLNDTKDGIKELMTLVTDDLNSGKYVYMGLESTVR
ncbi:MAG: hypothetical protein IPO92_05465 [Saprospiraceae bacterium]|nr:hypothetical protein [Saprospiraceae bacterium]